VVGADNPEDQTSPQVHYDAEKGFLKRVYIPNYNAWHEAIFENKQAFGNGWLEMKVTIYKDKKPMLLETYKDAQTPKNEAENADFEKKINIRK
jgi:hypothetical protein